MKHYEVVGAIFLKDGKVLGMKRGPGKNPMTELKYEFPGGKIEPGETKSRALMRELSEEMDLDISITEDQYYMTSDYEYPEFSVSLHVFVCRVDELVFSCKEHIGFVWLEPEKLETVVWAPADYPIMEQLKKEPESFYR